MIAVRLEPLDSWFFRGGTPFTLGTAPQDDVESLFPPHPATVIGSLRVALAQTRGWNGRGRWPETLHDVLGDGPGNLGALSFDGPILLREEKPLFRTPRHLLGVSGPEGWRPSAFIRPGSPSSCDLGDGVRLPELPRRDEALSLKTGDREWLTEEGLRDVLEGRFPKTETVVAQEDLWSIEERTGLERARDTRSALEGKLYSTRHVRLTHRVSLGICINGLPADWIAPFGCLVPLGGESRLAECREWRYPTIPGGHPEPDRRMALIALSPLDLEPAVIQGKQPLASLGGARVVSACLDRPQRIGGWDSRTRRPLALRSALMPGSVLFCEAPKHGRTAFAAEDGVLRIGARQAWGFGLVAVGRWPQDLETPK